MGRHPKNTQEIGTTRRPIRQCKNCKLYKKREAFDLCKPCYVKLILVPRQRQELEPTRKRGSKLRRCLYCRRLKKHQAKGLCKSCYIRFIGFRLGCKTLGEEQQALNLYLSCASHNQKTPVPPIKSKKRPRLSNWKVKTEPVEQYKGKGFDEEDPIILSSGEEDEMD